jgi:hypothetical protein
MLSKIFYISFSLIIIITLLYNNDYSSKSIIKISNDELKKIKKFINLKELDDLIYNITILNNYFEKNNKYNEIINLIEKSNIEIEIINNYLEKNNYFEKNNKYNNEIINIIEKSNIEIEIITKEIEKIKSEL